uniref:Uncharacterized protein n=1 Tax=Lepeophtheirus salmonis TaxID=72036 RepID=A0A0K2UGM4_LEPSM
MFIIGINFMTCIQLQIPT